MDVADRYVDAGLVVKDPVCQLDSNDPDMRAHGCAVCSGLYEMGWATNGDALPDGQGPRDQMMDTFRKRSGATLAEFRERGLLMDEVEKAYESWTYPGRMPPRMRRLRGGSLRDDIIPELQDGRIAHICVNYGALQDAGKASPLSTFTGGHALVIGEPANGKVSVADPLRRDIVRISFEDIEHAMETFGENPWGGGRGEAAIVLGSPTWERAYTLTKAQLSIAEEQLERKDRAIAKAQAETKTANAALALAEAAVVELRADLDAAHNNVDTLSARIEALEQELAAAEAEVARLTARVAELEAQQTADCEPLVDAARAEGRASMQAEAVLAITSIPA